MKYIGQNISFKDHDNDSTTVVIMPKRELWKDIVLGAWLLLFSLVGIYIIIQLFGEYTKEQKLTFIVFLSFWAYFEFRVGKAFLWLTKGREFIKMTPGEFQLKKGIGNYGKVKRYFFDNMGPFEKISPKQTSISFQFEKSYWVVGGETISFDYQGKTIVFGRKLTDEERRLLLQVLQKRRKKYTTK